MSMTEPEFRALVDRYLNGNASPAERKLLDQFFDSYRDEHPGITGINPAIKEEILSDLRKKKDADITIVPMRKWGTWVAIAASVSFIMAASYFVFNNYNSTSTTNNLATTIDHTTTRGQKADIVLPDGTKVKLNSNSHFTYPEKFQGNTREVVLDGEAYFEVTHDASKPFIVHTNNAATKVLGTSFNVNANTEVVTVTLVEGKVNVSTPTGNATLLPSQQASITSGSRDIVTRKVDVTEYTAWVNNRLIFDNMRLEDAFAVLENWYNVDISVSSEAIKNCVITAKYENESLENVLNSFQFMLKMDYTINKHVVTINGKGCN